MGFGEDFGAFGGNIAEHSKIEKEKLVIEAGTDSSRVPAWEHSYGNKKKSTTHPFY